jgi:hypothetical protein
MGSTSGLSSPTLARRAAVAPRPHDSSAESEFRLSGVRPDSETWPSSRQGPSRPGPAGARCGAGSALQDSRLLNHAHKVRHRLFVDGRRLRLSRLLDFGQVAAGQDCQEAGCHGPSKRSSRREATVLASLRNHQRKGVQLSETPLSLLTISAYRSAWLATLSQLWQRFLRTWAAASLCGKPSKRRHSWA